MMLTPIPASVISIRNENLQQHIENDLLVTCAVSNTSQAIRSNDLPLTQRPTRWNRWEMRQQIYCCGHWWNGDTCLYGNHRLK